MRHEASATLLLLAAGIALTLCARGTTESASPDGYSHATATCLQGSDGTGLRLRLRRQHHCDGSDTYYPYLGIDIKEQLIEANESLVVGDTNSAFRCQNPKKSCQQFASGEMLFNHFEEISSNGLQTDGWYELRFPTGLPETGRFKVDCFEPCG